MTSHVVIDGSNIATEGRKLPNLKQLDQAVAAFLKEHPHDNHTVVVDATFGHRISTRERNEYDERISTGRMITPPAGAIGRGDAFVLEIAERANATVLSNDSFQEFHGSHDWLFDEGRLIGGKPVAGIGWVFVFRAPVRGVTSRRAVRDARSNRGGSGGRNTRNGAARPSNRRSNSAGGSGGTRAPRKAAPKGPTSAKTLNEFIPFIEFVGAHPIGSSVKGTVSRFSSHGAYADVGGAHCYIPLKSISDPAPRSAREVFEIGQEVEFEVSSIDTPRRGIDLGVPGFTPPATDEADEPDERRSREDADAHEAAQKRGRRRKPPADDNQADLAAETAQRRAAATRPDGSKPRIGERRRAVKGPAAKRSKRAAEAAEAEASANPVEAEAATPVKNAPAKKAAAKKTAAKKAPAKKAAAKKAPVAKKAPAKKAAAKKTAAKKAPAKKAAAKKAPVAEAAAPESGESVRIYQLSKELDLANKVVLAACADLGIEAKSHSSSVSATDAASVRAALNGEGSSTAKAPAKKKKAPAKKRAKSTK